MSRNLTSRTTIENLAAELKKKFTASEAGIAAAFKSAKAEGSTVKFYTSADKTGAPAFTMDFPVDMVLDQARTAFVDKFAWSETAYPGSTDPGLDNKPVMVLAVKGEGENPSYSFLNMARLVDTYTARAEGKDASTTVEISGYEVEVKVNISAEEGNLLQLKGDGLFVPAPAAVDVSGKTDKVSGAAAGNLAALDDAGNLADSGLASAKVLTEDDVSDYTAEEITALLSAQ